MALSFVLYITVVDLGEMTLMSVFFFFPLVYPKEHYQALIHIYGSILYSLRCCCALGRNDFNDCFFPIVNSHSDSVYLVPLDLQS